VPKEEDLPTEGVLATGLSEQTGPGARPDPLSQLLDVILSIVDSVIVPVWPENGLRTHLKASPYVIHI